MEKSANPIRSAGRAVFFGLVRGLTRLPLPGFKRIYCADPNLAFLTLNLRDLQLRGLFRGLQIISENQKERAARRERLTTSSGETETLSEKENLWQAITYSLAIDLEVQLDQLEEQTAANPERKRSYLNHAEKAAELLLRDLKRFRPHMIMTAQGYGIESMLARNEAAKRSIPLLALENTALKDRVLWEPISGVTVNRNIGQNLFWRYDGVTSQTEADAFCESIIRTTKQNKQDEHRSPERQWQAADACIGPTVLYLGQVYTDSSLLYGCYPDFGPESVVEALYDWCDGHGARLVLKLHPKEAKGIAPVTHQPYDKLTLRRLEAVFQEQRSLNRNWVTVDSENEWDTYGLIERADIVVTINSQAGLEAAIRGKRVVTCGRCFYAGMDFTDDVKNPKQLKQVLNDRAGHSAQPQESATARRFFFVFFNRYCLPLKQDAILTKVKALCRARGLF